MPDAKPTMLRRRLGSILKTMRVRTGLNLAEAAKLLGLPGPPALSKIENGKQRPDLEKFFTVYKVKDAARIAETIEIARLSDSARQRRIFTQFRDVIRPQFADFLELEEIATHTDAYAALAIPGLLQTAAYAHAIIQGGSVWSTARDVRNFVELRMKRQEVLAIAPGDEPSREPLTLRCVLDEASLRRAVGGPVVHRGQLEHLLLMSKLPNVELRVLPFASGAHTGMDGSFTIFHLAASDPVVAVEPLTHSLYFDEDARVARYTSVFEFLLDHALNPAATQDFITRIVKDAT
ncbi:helix-turn-helix domain-containing protein [Streptomyces sp. NPDC020379]|uniref:helix-turn-helix domain-containing protein n=1 Tax=Streptomyces sp. NPDC020379 TaxID=3365071 RepID=UPI00379DF911